MILIERFLELARLWSSSTGRPLTTLASRVANNSQLFRQVEKGSSITLATFDRFVGFYSQPQNWGEGGLPEAARALLDMPVLAETLDHAAGDTMTEAA